MKISDFKPGTKLWRYEDDNSIVALKIESVTYTGEESKCIVAITATSAKDSNKCVIDLADKDTELYRTINKQLCCLSDKAELATKGINTLVSRMWSQSFPYGILSSADGGYQLAVTRYKWEDHKSTPFKVPLEGAKFVWTRNNGADVLSVELAAGHGEDSWEGYRSAGACDMANVVNIYDFNE